VLLNLSLAFRYWWVSLWALVYYSGPVVLGDFRISRSFLWRLLCYRPDFLGEGGQGRSTLFGEVLLGSVRLGRLG
jgi:hypothetical protein